MYSQCSVEPTILNYTQPLKPQFEKKFKPALDALNEAAKNGVVAQFSNRT